MQTSNSNYFLNSLLRKLISDTNIHAGLRVLIAMAITFIPAIEPSLENIFNQQTLTLSIYLCLGVMASAIVETDDNYKGRGKFIVTIAGCFFIASTSIELLMPYPILFAIGLFLSSFTFMMLAVYGTHYNKIGFGAVLIAIYTMIGYQTETSWYIQPLYFSLGALWYGFFSIIWNICSPYQSLRVQLAQLFFTLSRYQLQKAMLFNESEGRKRSDIFAIRQQLALINISIMARLVNSKNIIQSRFQISHKQEELNRLNYLYFVAEQIHERICASQYSYSQLESQFGKSQILEGYHQLLLQLSEDCYQLGLSITDKKNYQHSRRLKWNVRALSDQLHLLQQQDRLTKKESEAMQALQTIFDNISEISHLLKEISKAQQDNSIQTTVVPVDMVTAEKLGIRKTFSNALKPSNMTFKHAMRISICLSIAYILQYQFSLTHGFWLLLTVLFVCQPSFSETRKRLVQRTIGTLLGILICYPIIMFIESSWAQVILLLYLPFCSLTIYVPIMG